MTTGVFCRNCQRKTRWRLMDQENAEWCCRECGHRRFHLADAYDAGNIPAVVVAEYIRRNGPDSLDCVGGRDDAVGHLFVELWAAWVKWESSRGVPFTAFATGTLRNKLLNFVRDTVGGYDGAAVRPLAIAESLDGPVDADGDRLERAIGGLEDHSVPDRSPDVTRALAEGSRAAARREREARERAPSSSAPGGSRAA